MNRHVPSKSKWQVLNGTLRYAPTFRTRWTIRTVPLERRRHSEVLSALAFGQKRWSHLATKIEDEKPHILFCGSDHFSIAALRALLARVDNGTLGSVSVVCRPGKRVGRGLKEIRDVPLKSFAESLSLPVHVLPTDTFTKWTPPTPPSLIITASFGLFVPSRLLRLAKHGGINLHPSLLPDLPGAGPIHHALLQGREWTGVSVQRLHEKSMDTGKVVAQRWVRVEEGMTLEELARSVTDEGATLLGNVIDLRKFVESGAGATVEETDFSALISGGTLGTTTRALDDSTQQSAPSPTPSTPPNEQDNSSPRLIISHAPKITPVDRHLDWTSASARDIVHRSRVLSNLWDTTTHPSCGHSTGPAKRVIFSRFSLPAPGPTPLWRVAQPIHPAEEATGIAVPCRDGSVGWVRVPRCLRPGDPVLLPWSGVPSAAPVPLPSLSAHAEDEVPVLFAVAALGDACEMGSEAAPDRSVARALIIPDAATVDSGAKGQGLQWLAQEIVGHESAAKVRVVNGLLPLEDGSAETARRERVGKRSFICDVDGDGWKHLVERWNRIRSS